MSSKSGSRTQLLIPEMNTPNRKRPFTETQIQDDEQQYIPWSTELDEATTPTNSAPHTHVSQEHAGMYTRLNADQSK